MEIKKKKDGYLALTIACIVNLGLLIYLFVTLVISKDSIISICFLIPLEYFLVTGFRDLYQYIKQLEQEVENLNTEILSKTIE